MSVAAIRELRRLCEDEERERLRACIQAVSDEINVKLSSHFCTNPSATHYEHAVKWSPYRCLPLREQLELCVSSWEQTFRKKGGWRLVVVRVPPPHKSGSGETDPYSTPMRLRIVLSMPNDKERARILSNTPEPLILYPPAVPCNLFIEEKCVVCDVEEADVLFYTCHHLCVCNACMHDNTITSCPLCRTPIGDYCSEHGWRTLTPDDLRRILVSSRHRRRKPCLDSPGTANVEGAPTTDFTDESTHHPSLESLLSSASSSVHWMSENGGGNSDDEDEEDVQQVQHVQMHHTVFSGIEMGADASDPPLPQVRIVPLALDNNLLRAPPPPPPPPVPVPTKEEPLSHTGAMRSGARLHRSVVLRALDDDGSGQETLSYFTDDTEESPAKRTCENKY